MLVGGFGVLMGMLTMLLSRRSVCFRLVMLTNIVMMCRLKVVMGRCVVMCGSSVMMLAGSVLLFFRHLNRHSNVLLNKSVSARSKCARCESVTACLSARQSTTFPKPLANISRNSNHSLGWMLTVAHAKHPLCQMRNVPRKARLSGPMSVAPTRNVFSELSRAITMCGMVKDYDTLGHCLSEQASWRTTYKSTTLTRHQ